MQYWVGVESQLGDHRIHGIHGRNRKKYSLMRKQDQPQSFIILCHSVYSVYSVVQNCVCVFFALSCR